MPTQQQSSETTARLKHPRALPVQSRHHQLCCRLTWAALLMACAPAFFAQAPELVADLRTGSEIQSARSIDVWGADARAYFAGLDGSGGTELWITDGSAGGTHRVADVFPGPMSSDPEGGALADGQFFFVADDGFHGRELWKTDGTTAGTILLKDICPGPCGIEVGRLDVHNDLVYLFQDNDLSGESLWISDGTTAGTSELFVPDGSLGFPTDYPIAGVANLVFFAADSNGDGDELFATDGTSAGTYQVADIRPGLSGSKPADFARLGAELLFSADDGTNGRELWVSDGTALGTVPVAFINSAGDSDPVPIARLDGSLLFAADDGLNGRQLWKTNGTAATLVTSLATPSSVADVRGIRFDGNVYFQAEDSAGLELWRTDGTTAGTQLYADIDPAGSSEPSDFYLLGDRIVFRADDGTNGPELWTTDGVTTNRVSNAGDLTGGIEASAVLTDDRLVYQTGSALEKSVKVSDGASSTVTLPRGSSPRSSAPTTLTPWNGGIAFGADADDIVTQLHTSDGTAAGTLIHNVIPPDFQGVNTVVWMADWNGLLYIANQGTFAQRRLLSWDGASGETVVSDSGGWTSRVVKTPSAIVFEVSDALHRLDGSPLSSLGDAIIPGAPSVCSSWGAIGDLVILGGGSSGWDECELFAVDLTDNSSLQLADLFGLGPEMVGSFNDKMIFVTDGELWATDGTIAGSIPLGPANLTGLGAVNGGGATSNGFMFVYDNPDSDRHEVWITDGTPLGTNLLIDLSGEVSLHFLAATPGGIYFSAVSGVWFSSGTIGGTGLVVSGFRNVRSLATRGDDLVFAGIEAAGNGHELYYLQGSTGQLDRIPDVEPGPAGSSFDEALIVGDTLYLSTYRDDVGTELFKVDLASYPVDTTALVFADGFESGDASSWP